jgi:hypothetical protein
MRATLPFKSNRGGRCLAASQTVTNPDFARSHLAPLYGLIVLSKYSLSPVRSPLPFKSNRGGRCEAANEAAPAPILVCTPARKKNEREKKMTTTDKHSLLKKKFLLGIVICMVIDFYLFPCYIIYIDRKNFYFITFYDLPLWCLFICLFIYFCSIRRNYY